MDMFFVGATPAPERGTRPFIDVPVGMERDRGPCAGRFSRPPRARRTENHESQKQRAWSQPLPLWAPAPFRAIVPAAPEVGAGGVLSLSVCALCLD